MIRLEMKQETISHEQMIVTVENLLPYGVFVRLENGTKGYIRRREMSWAGDVDPRQLVKVNQQIEAVFINNPEDHRKVELSHKLTLPDPWHQFTAKYKHGNVVEACVKDVQPHGIFVQILVGVNGFIPLTELASWAVTDPSELFWVDDRVEAVITQINATKKQVRLSIRRHMQQQRLVQSVMEALGDDGIIEPDDDILLSDLSDKNSLSEALNSPADPDIIAQVGSILIVEDMANLRDSFVQWLQSQGYKAVGACDVVMAIQQIEQRHFGLCFVDLDLPGEDGLAFIEYLRQKKCDSLVVMMSSSDWLAERIQDIEQAGVLTVLFKPLDLCEVNSLLNQIGHGNKIIHPWQHHLPAKVQSTANAFQNLANMMQDGRSFEERLKEGLRNVFELTQAEVGILFYLDPISKTITVKAQIGRAVLDEEAMLSLTDSPVKDVLPRRKTHFRNSRISYSLRPFP